jgi:ABC-type multidrug transport system fused ATPase/permease subunit
MIAHRLSTIVDADRVVVIEGGRITASGRHEDLLRESDHYRALIQTQLVADGGQGDAPTA